MSIELPQIHLKDFREIEGVHGKFYFGEANTRGEVTYYKKDKPFLSVQSRESIAGEIVREVSDLGYSASGKMSACSVYIGKGFQKQGIFYTEGYEASVYHDRIKVQPHKMPDKDFIPDATEYKKILEAIEKAF